MLFDMIKDAEHKAGVAAPPPQPRRLDAADKEVLQLFIERLRRQILAEIAAAQKTETTVAAETPNDG
jgi:hypothetical protein